MQIPYLDIPTSKAIEKIVKKPKVILATHDSAFHADDVFTSAFLKTFFVLALPKQKYSITRNSVNSPKLQDADVVYDCGRVYDASKLRFDHHQTGGAGTYENGIKYSSFGLLWKHLGQAVCALYIQKKTGKTAPKKMVEGMSKYITEYVVAGIDAMDNGQNLVTLNYAGIYPFSFDFYVYMCKTSTISNSIEAELHKALNKKFFSLVKMVEGMFDDILMTAYTQEHDKMMAEKMYMKAKDKRVIICDKVYRVDYSVFTEALFFVYPHARGGWGAEVVRKSFDSYEPRLAFPKEWGGKEWAELQAITGVKDARFCHNGLFLATANTKKSALELVDKALQSAGLQSMVY